ncbi:putative lipoprotein [Neorhizobium galegae]|uniref:imelysin family protein n=1 Tax=Neorhizobium galegae TaxID=399 RepID=UPI001AE6F337|nr:imelysin family protein [Neorhizobium galegae]MBP2559719.1 putative lipoprotein [Neorhizobium galegae]
MRKILLAGLVSLLPVAALAQEGDAAPSVDLPMADVTRVMAAAVDGFIRPGYDAFHESAGRMTAAMKALCEAPSRTNYDAAKNAFRDAAVSWAHIEVVRVGPVIEHNRFERILFYPDRKSTGLKQVQSVLSKADETATDPLSLGTKSVAMQGFGALEYVLAGSGSDELLRGKQSFRCRYGAAVAGNIANVAKELSDIWDDPNGIQKAWEQPGPDNPNFRTGGEAITALLGILVHGAEAVRDQRIETFYKGADKAKFPKQALFWRSENTWATVKGNLEGLAILLEKSGMVSLLQEKDRPIVAATQAQLKSMIELSGKITPDLEKAVENAAERKKLDTLLADGKGVISKLNDGYGGAIGLSSGFSFADGD